MSIFRRFDGMCWAAPGEEMEELAHKFRYSQQAITSSDMFAAATVMECYGQLIARAGKRRAEIIRELREGPNLPPAALRSITDERKS